MAKNLVYKYTESKTRVRVLTASVVSGTALLDPSDQRPAIALTNSGDTVKTLTASDIPLGGGVTSITYADGGVGLSGHETTLAYDGTWDLPTFSTGTTPAPTSTPQGTAVYINGSGAATLASASATLFGHVDYPTDYFKRIGILPVRVGS